MTNLQLVTDSLPKDASGARMLAPLNDTEFNLRFTYLAGMDGRTKSDNDQDVTVSYLGVFPMDSWKMVGAGVITTASDAAVAAVPTDLSAYPDHAVGLVRLHARTNAAIVAPNGVAFTGMYLPQGTTFEMKMKVTDIALLECRNGVPASNITLDYAVFIMPTGV